VLVAPVGRRSISERSISAQERSIFSVAHSIFLEPLSVELRDAGLRYDVYPEQPHVAQRDVAQRVWLSSVFVSVSYSLTPALHKQCQQTKLLLQKL
jgi:hypothetical protein